MGNNHASLATSYSYIDCSMVEYSFHPSDLSLDVFLDAMEMDSNKELVEGYDDYNGLVKLLMVGDSNVGKSSLIMSLGGKYSTTAVPTIAVDFRVTHCLCKLQEESDSNELIKLKLQLWDTSGQERFQDIVDSYYKGSHVIFIVYDVTDKTSFQHVQSNYLREVGNCCLHAPVLVLIANKCDLSNRVVSQGEGELLAGSIGALYFETTAASPTAFKWILVKAAKKAAMSGKISTQTNVDSMMMRKADSEENKITQELISTLEGQLHIPIELMAAFSLIFQHLTSAMLQVAKQTRNTPLGIAIVKIRKEIDALSPFLAQIPNADDFIREELRILLNEEWNEYEQQIKFFDRICLEVTDVCYGLENAEYCFVGIHTLTVLQDQLHLLLQLAEEHCT